MLKLNAMTTKTVMTDAEIEEMRKKIEAGILLARKRLVEKTKREGGELVIMRDGKIVHVKADEL